MKKLLFILLATFLMSCGTYQVTVRPSEPNVWYSNNYYSPYVYTYTKPIVVIHTRPHNHGNNHTHRPNRPNRPKHYGHRK